MPPSATESGTMKYLTAYSRQLMLFMMVKTLNDPSSLIWLSAGNLLSSLAPKLSWVGMRKYRNGL